MNISIECLPASGAEAARQVRQQVFGSEWRLSLPQVCEYHPGRQLTLVARDRSSQEPVAALTVAETTGDAEVHGRVGLSFLKGERVARHTQLAVLKPYRGLNLSIRLILEAQRRFVAPQNIRYTWLLFDAARASGSLLCALLGFHCGSAVIRAEHGPCRLLFRDELSVSAQSGNRRGWAYLTALAESKSVPEVEPLFSRRLDATGRGESISPPPAT